MSKDLDLSIFCENIVFLRKHNNYSKTKMAKLLGTSIKSLNSIENGKVPKKLGCRILDNIYINFGILPKEIFLPLSKKH